MREARWLQFAAAMRIAFCLVLVAACGIQNKVAPDGDTSDGTASSDGSAAPGDGSAAQLTITLDDKPAVLGNQAAVSFSFSTSIPATTECKVDDAAYAPCTSPDTASGLTDAMHTFDVRATAGDMTAAIPTYSFTVDTKPPAMMITGQPATSSPVATAQFYFQKDDATTVTCQLDTAAAMPCMNGVMYTGLADGSHTFTLTGTDGAGNTMTKTYTWTIDTSTPALAITSEPPNPSTTTTANFQFMIGNSVTVTCQLDSGTASACTNPKSYTGLADGSHTFTLKGTNSAGTTTTASYTWVVDATPPSITLSSTPPAITSATTAQFQFMVNGATTVTCQLDSGTPAACTNPWTYSGLPDGSHTFTLRATDGAGNTATKTYTWTVDTMPPTVTITGTPTDPTSTSATFTFTAPMATTTCSLDGATATACTSPKTYTGLADGSHTFKVIGTDGAGNSASQSYSWSIDSTPPVVTIGNPPPTYSKDTMVSINFSVNEMSTVTCQLNGGNPNICTSPYMASGLMNGQQYTLRVVATDAAGNAGTASAVWNVDTVPPTVAITSKPSSTSHTATIGFSVSEGQPMCSIDLGPSVACSNPVTYTLGDGGHTIVVSTTDEAGNYASDTWSWTIDTTKPAISLTSSCSGGTYYENWTVSDANGLASGTCTFTYSSGTFTQDCLNLRSSSGSIVGGGTFKVTYTDPYGNIGTASKAWTSLSCE